MNDNQDISSNDRTDISQPVTPDTREAFLARMGIDPEKMAAYEAEYARLRDQAITTLTAIARLDQPGYGQMDFAGLLAETLTAVAANLGSSGHLVAGRSGSWEADLVFQLVAGTAGWDDEYLLEHRTEPVKIYLSVSRVVEDAAWDRGDLQPGQPGGPYYQELEQVTDRHDALDEDVYDREADDAEAAGVTSKWATRYQEYAQAFTAAVQQAAAGITGLAVPVEVTSSIDPDQADDDYTPHPPEANGPSYDPIAYQLWTAALAAVPVPADWTATTSSQPGEQS